MTTITLSASSDFGHSGQYIARLVGRAARVQFAREFVGKKWGKRNEGTSYETDEVGLYEVSNQTRKGCEREYWLILPWKDELKKIRTDLEDSLAICKRLQDGERIEDFVRLELGEPITDTVTHWKCAECGGEVERGHRCPAHPEAQIILSSEYVPARNEKGEPRHKLVYAIHSRASAREEKKAATLETAIEAIMQALQALPLPLQRKALSAAKSRITPPKEAADDAESAKAEVAS